MKVGLCTGVQTLKQALDMGYDYAELPLTSVAAMGDAEYKQLQDALQGLGWPVPVMNVFLPGDLRLTGEQVDQARIRAYLEGAFARAAELGVETIVFGSGGARNVPDGFDRTAAMDQLAWFLTQCDDMLRGGDLRIAIEPLCKKECNILNTVSEATALAKRVNRPHIGVLGDLYHMAMEEEPLTAFLEAGPLLWHVHVANPEGRRYPRQGDAYDYAAAAAMLRQAGYDRRISVEVAENAFESAAPEARRVIGAAFG